MSYARETAEAVSEGFTCIAEILETLTADAPSPRPDWLATTEAMERALEAIRAKRVTTDAVVTDEQVDRIRQIRLAISHWQDTSQPPQELLTLAEGFLRSFNLHYASLSRRAAG